MTLIYRKGDLIQLTVPTLSGWQGIGIVLEQVHQDDDPDTMVAFRKQGAPEDAAPCLALLNEIKPVTPMDDLRQASAEVSGVKILSPAALATWSKFYDIVEDHGPPRLGLAAALRAVAEECRIEWNYHPDYLETKSVVLVSDLLAIAAELEAQLFTAKLEGVGDG